jgi:hypothetical protein
LIEGYAFHDQPPEVATAARDPMQHYTDNIASQIIPRRQSSR